MIKAGRLSGLLCSCKLIRAILAVSLVVSFFSLLNPCSYMKAAGQICRAHTLHHTAVHFNRSLSNMLLPQLKKKHQDWHIRLVGHELLFISLFMQETLDYQGSFFLCIVFIICFYCLCIIHFSTYNSFGAALSSTELVYPLQACSFSLKHYSVITAITV